MNESREKNDFKKKKKSPCPLLELVFENPGMSDAKVYSDSYHDKTVDPDFIHILAHHSDLR